MAISMSGKLPAGDGNGLSAIIPSLIREDHGQFHVVIGLVDCKKFTTDKDSGETVPTVRIRRIEVVQREDDMRVARSLMQRALEERTGQETLPYDLQAEMEAAFGSDDPSDYLDDTGIPGAPTGEGDDDGNDDLP